MIKIHERNTHKLVVIIHFNRCPTHAYTQTHIFTHTHTYTQTDTLTHTHTHTNNLPGRVNAHGEDLPDDGLRHDGPDVLLGHLARAL